MRIWIAFFRGINVGGHHILPMKELESVLEKLGCGVVTTYIQSGNVIFSHKESSATKLEAAISQAVQAKFGFEPRVLVLTRKQLNLAQSNNPFSARESEPKTLHLFFLSNDAVDADWETLEALKATTEQILLIDRVFYLHAPDGIGRSKLAARVEKCLGVPATGRNWRTVEKVLQLATAAKN